MNHRFNDCEAVGRKWYAVYSKPQREEFARNNLFSRGIEVFFPKLRVPANLQSRVVPLFPSYLFARFNASSEEFGQVAWCPGVKRVISFGDRPAIVEDHLVNFLKGHANHEGAIFARSSLATGQRVQIEGGPFDSLVGMIERPPNSRGRVKVLINILNRPTSVDVSACCIRNHWVAPESSAAREQ